MSPPSTSLAASGAGVTRQIGEDASNKWCDLASGVRYITSGEPHLELRHPQQYLDQGGLIVGEPEEEHAS